MAIITDTAKLKAANAVHKYAMNALYNCQGSIPLLQDIMRISHLSRVLQWDDINDGLTYSERSCLEAKVNMFNPKSCSC